MLNMLLTINRFRTGQGCAFLMHRWKSVDSPNHYANECGETQTMYHILSRCNIHRLTGDINELNDLTNDAIRWLNDLEVKV